ncbi:elongator complex protein 5 [Hemiscyllium ocellatum]|uniref:elongator complex protein 5 n=1 Tax=Hemiscyllium ocellatum TaxID=170820 RepID=UPI00296679B9|nr:elongator complex protein 5 [Hemiscyllium ocellatum]
MLEGLSRGSEPPGLLLIADSFECEGRSLLKSFVTSAVLRGECVHVFTFELSIVEFSVGLDDGVRTRLQFHDGFSDPLDWEQMGALPIRTLSGQELVGRVRGVGPGPSQQPLTVVLDSLSSLLQHRPSSHLARELQGFQQRAATAGLTVRRLLALLHTDLHPPEVLQALGVQLGATVITVTPSPEGSRLPGSSLPSNVASIVQKRKSGKVVRQEENFTIETGFRLISSVEPPLGKQGVARSDSVSVRPDPAAHLPFNLRLTEQEREAREQVPLPYHFSTEKKMSLLDGGSGDGRIYYQPDESDDVDEEDPDDDLDF